MTTSLTFIGNCQMLSLCYFFQQLLFEQRQYKVHWLLYGDEFKQYLFLPWSDKCQHKISNYEEAKLHIQNSSDIIFYQEIHESKSEFCNTAFLTRSKKATCRLIKLPSIYIDYSNFDQSLNELRLREDANLVALKVSPIIAFYKKKGLRKLMLDGGRQHPTTYFFLRIMHVLCHMLQLPFFPKDHLQILLRNDNVMELTRGW